MQAALDASGLILSKHAQSLSAAQLQAKASAVFLANFNRPDVSNIKITPTFTSPMTGTYNSSLVGEGFVETTIAALIQPTMAIGATTEVTWGMKRLELAMALDNTGSMASWGKLTQLKLAAKELIATLKTAAKKPDEVKIAIIPFDTTVIWE